MTFALVLLPLLACAGAALDYSRSITDRTRLQAALDAAVLAAAAVNVPDEQRVKRAQDVFRGMLSTTIGSQVNAVQFSLDGQKTRVQASASATVPTTLMRLFKFDTVEVGAQSASLIARPQVRQLDLVMCIDATGSMTPTINAVKTNALNLESNLNAELARRGIAPFDAMRVRAIFYRDFGGNPSGSGSSVGDNPPLNTSKFYKLPDERSDFSSFVQAESARGGGDEPEAGLECVNEGMNSSFARVGDSVPGSGGKKLTGVFPTIVVWTDANTHPPNYPVSLRNPAYPPASKMPRSHADLLAKWNDPTVIDQAGKLLVFFGGPSTRGVSMDSNGWPPVFAWPSYLRGGTLAEGNNQLVSKLADAIASKVAMPVITH